MLVVPNAETSRGGGTATVGGRGPTAGVNVELLLGPNELDSGELLLGKSGALTEEYSKASLASTLPGELDGGNRSDSTAPGTAPTNSPGGVTVSNRAPSE